MNKIGTYEVNVQVGKLPQKVASCFDETMSKLLGATYAPVAYLGSQLVNGTNHAILCEQTVITGTDTKNAVLVILNEKEEGMSLVSITPILESGAPLGGIAVNVTTDIPAEAKAAFDEMFAQFVGSKVKPFALLGTQLVHGTNYFFAAEVSAIIGRSSGILGGDTSVALLRVNPTTREIAFETILG